MERTGQRLLKRDYFVVIVHNKTEYMFSSEENSVSRSRDNACSTTRNELLKGDQRLHVGPLLGLWKGVKKQEEPNSSKNADEKSRKTKD